MAVSMLLGGCTAFSKDTYESLRQVVLPASLSVDESTLAPDAAYMRADIGSSQLVMGRGRTSDQGVETWYTATMQVMVLRGGLLESTEGMPANVRGIRHVQPHPLTLEGQLSLPATIVKEIDRPGFPLEVSEYRLTSCGEKSLSSWGRNWAVQCLKEVLVRSNAARPLPGGTYWRANDNGWLVQSLQYIAPDWPVRMQPRPGNPASVPAVVPVVSLADGQRQHLLVATEQIRLGELLLKYPLPEAWASATMWMSRAAEAEQQALKRSVLFDISAAQAGRLPAVPEVARLAIFTAQLKDMPVTGRKPLKALQPRWLQANPAANPLLEAGDRLVRFTGRDDGVVVIGNVAAPCRVPATGRVTVVAALHECRIGATWPDTVYVITPEGEVRPVDVALWNRSDEPLRMGSRILVPFPSLARRSGNPQADIDMARWLATQPSPSLVQE